MEYLELDEQLRRWQVGLGAAEFHGGLVAHLVCEGRPEAVAIADQLALESLKDEVLAEPASAAALADYARFVRDQLASEDLDFEPLLPEADASVADRANALCAWVRGFLSGLALSGRLREQGLDDETQELVGDLNRIAGSELEAADDEAAEGDLVELLEFVRMGVLYLRDELLARGKPVSETRH